MSYTTPIINQVTYYRAVDRTFESYEVPVGDGTQRARWFIMRIDTRTVDLYDWIAASLDFTYDQGTYLVALNRDDLLKDIAKYSSTHELFPNQPLFKDQFGQPWLVARCNGCVGSGKYGMAMTAAYDGVAVYPAVHPTGGYIYADTTPKAAQEYAVEWVKQLATVSVPPPPAMAPFDKYVAPVPAGPGGGPVGPGGGPVGPGGVPVPPPPPPPPPPVASSSASSSASPILLAGVAAAAVYLFTRKK